MKVTLDLPEWVDERTIRIFAGIELVAKRYPWDDFWKVKVERCVQCGKCCSRLKPGKHYFPVVDGKCVHLGVQSDGKAKCNIVKHRPRTCGNDPMRLIEEGVCSITHRKVPV